MQHAIGMTKLNLSVYKKNDRAVFEITDDGCGIDKERLKNIFTGYFEKKETPIDNQKHSMGIGLSVCASIIKAHEGLISASNRPEGGCCFTFSLKLEEEDE